MALPLLWVPRHNTSILCGSLGSVEGISKIVQTKFLFLVITGCI